jgi:hypothetical protein
MRVGRPSALTQPWTVTAVARTSSLDRQQVRHLERRPRGRAEAQVHVHHLVEPQRLAVLHERLEYRVVHALGAQFGVRMAQRRRYSTRASSRYGR